jgi:hypothetical protein
MRNARFECCVRVGGEMGEESLNRESGKTDETREVGESHRGEVAMSVRKTVLAAAVVVALGTSGAASAADGVPYSTAPAALCGPCGTSMGVSRFPKHKKDPCYSVPMCPGSCFGYFPTQWRRWDEACLSPQVIGELPPAIPHLPGASDRPPQDKQNGVPPPRVVDPKTGLLIPAPPGIGSLPQVPLYPGLGRY